MKPTQHLHDLGQRLWLDNINRELLDNGTLRRYIEDFSITGLTSNPTLFDGAIGSGTAYDAGIREKAQAGLSGERLFTELALEDLRRAADLFRPVFDASGHADGWVSMEVSPLLASDTQATIAAARQLHQQADRPNLFVKIPGTPEGIPAIEASIFAGVPVNVTLLFSHEQYLAAADAYLSGIERRLDAGLDPRVASVASLFVSRWDAAVNDRVPGELRNQLGIAISRRTYGSYCELLSSPRWRKLADAGAYPQRLLWASTGNKDPGASATRYVEALAAPNTINTLPEKTLHAFAEDGVLRGVMATDGGDAEAMLARFAQAGVDIDALAIQLQREGTQSFVKSWRQLLQRLADKSAAEVRLRTTSVSEPNSKSTRTLIASDWGSRSHVNTLVLMAVTVAGIYFCYRLSAPFLPALAWALALAVLFAPLHRWLEHRLKQKTLAATVCVVMIAVIVAVPATFAAERIIAEAARGAETIQTMVESGQWRRAFDAHPRIAPIGHWIERQFDLPGMVKPAISWLTTSGASLVRGSVLQLIGIVLTFYMLFYFLRDRRAALDAVRSLSPLSEADMDRLFANVSDTVHATLYGTLAVAIVQGMLGGLMFWWLGLPAPLLWGLVMGLLAVVPVLGAFVIWIPATILLVLEGSGGKALLLVLWGSIVVGGIDNLLYPILVGKRLKMHTLLAFISIVGGLIVFGPSGLILGPVIVTVTRLLLQIWSDEKAAATA